VSEARKYVNGLCPVTLADGSIVYYYKIQFRGQVYNGSTRTGSIRLAEAFRDSLKTELRNKAKRAALTPLTAPTLDAVHEEWLEVARVEFSVRHLKSFDSWWRLHIQPQLGRVGIDRIDTKRAHSVRAAYISQGGSRGGANNLMKTLNTLMRFAIRRRYILTLPYDLEPLPVQRGPRPVLPAKLIPKFLKAIDKSRNPNVSGVVRLIVGLGVRISEALGARWEYLDLTRKTYQPDRTKSGKSPMLHLPPWLVLYLRGIRGKIREGWMFPAFDGEPHREGLLRKPVERAGLAVGLKGLTPHRLRGTFATLHADIGTDVRKIQAMLGHSDVETTMIYIEDSTAGMAEAQAKLARAMGLGVKSKSAAKRAKAPRNISGTISGTKRKPSTKNRKQVK